MLQQIADLVEFDPNHFSHAQIVEDFNHKFHNSILKIDGKYVKVSHLESKAKGTTLTVFDKEGNEIGVKALTTIEKVLPKTGLYQSEFGLLYLYRLPKRQWIKSLRLGSNYQIQTLVSQHLAEIPTLWNTVLVDNPIYMKETCIYKGSVYLHWLKVGKVIDNTIYVTKERFFEEIKELWNPQYQIILDANNHQPKVEKLLLDF